MKPTVPLIPPAPFSTLTRIMALTSTLIALAAPTIASAAQCPNETLRTGPSAALPDCRAYELVSPADKGGVEAYPAEALSAQVSTSGEALEWVSHSAFPGAEGSTAVGAAHVSTRTGDGWKTAEWSPPMTTALSLPIYIVDYTFSPDLTQAIIGLPWVPLTPGAAPHTFNLFRRDSTGAYSLVDSNPPAVTSDLQCESFPPEFAGLCWLFINRSGFAGASSDFNHVLFESNAQVTENAPETGIESLYENSNGAVRLVGVLPDGKPAAQSNAGAKSVMGYESSSEQDQRVERAVSSDGSHVLFQAPSDGGEPDFEQNGQVEVYDRIDATETIEISKPAPGATPAVPTPEPATFQLASADGSRVFFTSSAELTTQSNTGEANNSEDLYEYDLETDQLTDLTIDTNPADVSTGAMVQGVVDSSTDGSYVYFVANGQLVAGKGTDGQPNLYVVHNGAPPVFIATLGTGGEPCNFIADPCVWSLSPRLRESYVTPDGRHMAFMSSASLPTVNFPGGYDNRDQETGQPDSQVYEYTAPTKPEEDGQLVCASCDPSGARPVGKAAIGGISENGIGHDSKEEYEGISTAFYRARAVSDNGQRLFYTAHASAMTPYGSVFEYEQSGEGNCKAVGGCQFRISEPNNTEADFFLGANASGGDVFLATASQVAAADVDNLRDIYDARVDGGASPPEEARCESGCRQPTTTPTAQPSLASSANGPSGNLAPVPNGGAATTKHLTRAQLLARALKACHAKHDRRRRAACEALARRRYGPKGKRAASHTTNVGR